MRVLQTRVAGIRLQPAVDAAGGCSSSWSALRYAGVIPAGLHTAISYSRGQSARGMRGCALLCARDLLLLQQSGGEQVMLGGHVMARTSGRRQLHVCMIKCTGWRTSRSTICTWTTKAVGR